MPPKDRLAAIADQIYSEPFRRRDDMHEAVIRKIVGDADLLWALFERYANAAIEVLLNDAMMRARAKREAAKASAATSTSSGATRKTNTNHRPPWRPAVAARPLLPASPMQKNKRRRPERIDDRQARH